MDARHVIIEPVISEKSYGLIEDNVYTFVVHPDSNKTQIKIAIEKLFKKSVLAVNTCNYAGKKKRERTASYGRKADWKKAIVTLKKGDKIELA